MSQVLDYSAGFPGAAAIKRAGYVGAVRYIGFPDRRKCTTRGEFADFGANAIGMALVFESSATDWRGGFGAGQVSGRRGRDHANAIGFPADRPIYMAIDQDVVTNGEFGLAVQYLRGANAALGGPGLTGVYGEAAVIEFARAHEVAAWFWQTAAWSRGARVEAHLFQHVGTVTVGGIGCDINDVLQDDWGQHNVEAGVSKQDVFEALTVDKYPNLGNRNVVDALGEVLGRLITVTDQTLPGMTNALGAVGTALTGLANKPTAELDAEDLAMLAGQFQAAVEHVLGGEQHFDVTVTRKEGNPS